MHTKKIAIVHYTYPPVIGGVERVMQAHARVFVQHGHQVKIISGRGDAENGIQVIVIPELRALASFDEDLNKKLKAGQRPEQFNRLQQEIFLKIEKELANIDVCIIHNVMTMHFNLPFTCALRKLIENLSPDVTFYLWCHDSALLNPAYQNDIPGKDIYPWNVLSRFMPQAEYIAISHLRKRELARLFLVSPQRIRVIPVGINLKSYLDISDSVWNLAWSAGLFEADVVMFFPSRILKRKNYQLGIQVTAEMKKEGRNCRFVITAPPDPHNPETTQYFGYLRKLCRDLDLESEVIFLSDWKQTYNLRLDDREIKDLYSICDLLFITSTQEGFGIPLLEAGAKRVPIICTNIEPFPEIAKNYALRVDLKEGIPEITTRILTYLDHLPTFHMFKRVALRYCWETIYKNHLKKLVD